MTSDSNTQLEAILDSVNAAIITIDSHGTVLSTNNSTSSLFGYNAEEVIGQNVKMLMPEPFRAEHDGYIQNHMKTNENKIIGIGRRVTGRRSNGSTFPMHLSVARFSEGGSVRFTGVVHDLTELDRSLANTARLGRIVDESINEVFVFDTQNLRFNMINRGALSNLGYSLEEMKMMSPVDIKPLHSRESFLTLLRPLLSGEKASQNQFRNPAPTKRWLTI